MLIKTGDAQPITQVITPQESPDDEKAKKQLAEVVSQTKQNKTSKETFGSGQ